MQVWMERLWWEQLQAQWPGSWVSSVFLFLQHATFLLLYELHSILLLSLENGIHVYQIQGADRSHTLSASWYFPSPLFRPLQLSLTCSTCLFSTQFLLLVFLSSVSPHHSWQINLTGKQWSCGSSVQYYLKLSFDVGRGSHSPCLPWPFGPSHIHATQCQVPLFPLTPYSLASSVCLEHGHHDFMTYACNASQSVCLRFQTVSSTSSG